MSMKDARRELRALLACARTLECLVTVGGCDAKVCGTYFDPKCSTVTKARKLVALAAGVRGRT